MQVVDPWGSRLHETKLPGLRLLGLLQTLRAGRATEAKPCSHQLLFWSWWQRATGDLSLADSVGVCTQYIYTTVLLAYAALNVLDRVLRLAARR